MTYDDIHLQHFELRIKPLLTKLYGSSVVEDVAQKLYALLQPHFAESAEEELHKWSENDVLLITYGNSIARDVGEKPLTSLERFCEDYLQDTITGVHLLPFFPFSSDDGFAVIDYLAVNPDMGGWQDIQRIAEKFDLMMDLVINHVSSESVWFEQFKQNLAPGRDYFITVDPETDCTPVDLLQVIRPRSTPLLAKVETIKGEKYVWATFSHDQVDLNFANPDVLGEIIKVILFYVNIGAKYIRLDAVGFLWKSIGTPCIHLPQTHIAIKLIREIVQMLNPAVALITETNVPNRENLSYFGNRDEAHMIYNFTLPPLVLQALLSGKSDHLKTWMMSMPPAPIGCAYLNFTASHDGIGVRPAEGLLTPEESQTMVAAMRQVGAQISMRKDANGAERVYEINISLFDAMQGTTKGRDKQWQIERFICSQTIMMSLEGIPAFYIHSLLATSNDYDKVKQTGRNRSINRHQWDYEELQKRLKDPKSPQAIILQELSRLIRIRRRQGAFHPNATQYTLHPLNHSIFAFWRQSMTRDQSIFSIHNLSDRTQRLQLSDLNLVIIDPWCDLISGCCIDDIYDKFVLKPYQSAWITNKF